MISFPDLLWAKPKARSGKVRKFVFLDWLLHLTPAQSPLKIYTVFRSKLECHKSNKCGAVREISNIDKNLSHLKYQPEVRDFSDYGKTVKLQRLIRDFAKVRVQEDDCFPKHLCRNCYRTLLNLRDKLLAFQTRCATTQINLGKGGENVKWTQNSPKSSPFTLPCGAQRQKKSSIST